MHFAKRILENSLPLKGMQLSSISNY